LLKYYVKRFLYIGQNRQKFIPRGKNIPLKNPQAYPMIEVKGKSGAGRGPESDDKFAA
jgi:hypothetical protein